MPPNATDTWRAMDASIGSGSGNARAKAAAIRGDAERLITLARNSAEATPEQKVHARRQAISKLGDNQVIKQLFDEIAPRFASRNGGYTRVTKLGPRLGDAAGMGLLFSAGISGAVPTVASAAAVLLLLFFCLDKTLKIFNIRAMTD